jgi:hypothetical protein
MAQPLLQQQKLRLTPQQRRAISKELQRCERAMLRWAKHEEFDVPYITSITGSMRYIR